MRGLWIIAAAAALAVVPQAALGHGGTEVTVKGEVTPNALIQIEGEEFGANDSVRIELRKEGTEPIALGEVAADEEGAFSVSLHLPVAVEPGIYLVAAEGEESAETDVTVLAPQEAGDEMETGAEGDSITNDAPAGETFGLAALTAALAVIGAGLVWLSRTRPHRTIS